MKLVNDDIKECAMIILDQYLYRLTDSDLEHEVTQRILDLIRIELNGYLKDQNAAKQWRTD